MPSSGVLQPGHLLPLSLSHWALALPAACMSEQYLTVMLLPLEYLGHMESQTTWGKPNRDYI